MDFIPEISEIESMDFIPEISEIKSMDFIPEISEIIIIIIYNYFFK